MSSFVGGLLGGVNGATDFWSGAIDIIVVRQPNGTLKCTPFHVRFGRMKLFRTKEKIIRIMVNGKLTDLCMKTGEFGEAYFVSEAEGPISEDLIASPVPSPPRSPVNDIFSPESSPPLSPRSKMDDMLEPSENDDNKYLFRPISPPPSVEKAKKPKSKKKQKITEIKHEGESGAELQKSLSSSNSPQELSPSTGVIGNAANPANSSSSWSWMWGQIPTKVSSWFGFRSDNNSHAGMQNMHQQGNQKNVSDEFAGLQLNHDFVEQHFYETLAKQYNYDAVGNKYLPGTSPPALFDMKQLEPVKINIGSGNNAAKQDTSAQIIKVNIPRVESSVSIASNTEEEKTEDQTLHTESEDDLDLFDDDLEEEFKNGLTLPQETSTQPIAIQPIKHVAPVNEATEFRSSSSGALSASPTKSISPEAKSVSPEKYSSLEAYFSEKQQQKPALQLEPLATALPPVSAAEAKRSSWTRWLPFGGKGGDSSTAPPTMPASPPKTILDLMTATKQLQKTLRPTSEQLGSLNLNEGKNEIKFLVTSRFQGTQEVAAHIYLWNHDAKILISDVDGTITRSDALGHILPMLGRDWSHAGIAQLYTNIKRNGYKIVYLTSRSIIQAGQTRGYISTLKQGATMLPDGPVIMAPDRLFQCLAREVIMKRPEEFKIAALRDIKNLFPNEYNPFYGGFGNKLNDFIAYRTVGVPVHKIFTVNTSSELICFGTKHRSYRDIDELAEYIFPPLTKGEQEVAKEFRSWNYWKTPLPKLDL